SVPGTRTTTTTPSRTRTATRAPAAGRVVSSTSASWSPGFAFRGTLAETRSDAEVRAGSAKRLGCSFSHEAAERAPRRMIRGRPRSVSAKPALEASTTTRFAPAFVSRTVDWVVPVSTTRAGTAVRATGFGTALAPTGASASAKAAGTRRAATTITGR